MNHYSFISHPIWHAFNSLKSLIPGLKIAYCGYCDNEKELIRFFRNDNDINPCNSEKWLVQKFRKQKGTLSWIRPDALNFINENQPGIKRQLSIEDEMENNMLCLKFLSNYDHLYDYILISIPNSSTLGMGKPGPLDAQSKAYIGNLVYQSLKEQIQSNYNNQMIHSNVLNYIEKITNQVQANEIEINFLKKEFQRSRSIYIEQLVNQINKENRKVTITEEAVNHLTATVIPTDQLTQILEDAANLAINLSLSKKAIIQIKKEHIHKKHNHATPAEEILFSKNQHLLDMLDKYEEAAHRATMNEWKINGNTISSLCSPPVTPSAITFNLKKYENQINELIDKFENRWPLLLTHFRPLQNILKENNQKEKKQA